MSDTATRDRTPWVLLLIVLAGLAVRALHFAALHGTAFPDFPLVARQSDLWQFWDWSSRILAGDLWGRQTWHPLHDWMAAWGTADDWARWWGGTQAFQSEPVYPYALAGLRAIGLGLTGILGFQLAASALVAVPVYFLTRRHAPSPGPEFAALLAVLYGPLVFYSGALLRDWLGALIEPGLVLLTLRAADPVRDRRADWLLLGLAMGAALLAKYTALLLVAGLGAWALLTAGSARGGARRALPLLAGAVLGFSPLLVRNAEVGAPLLQVSNRSIENIVMANVADVDPIGMQLSAADAPRVLEIAQGRTGVAAVETLRSYHGDLGLFAKRQWLRFRALADPFEIPNNLSIAYGESLSPVLSRLPGWGVVAPLGLAGLLIAGLGAPRRHAVLIFYVAAVAAPLFVQFVIDRYRIGLAIALCVGAGLLGARLAAWARERAVARGAGALLLVAGLALLQQRVLPIDALRHNLFMAVHPLSYASAVDIYVARGQLRAAHAEVARLRGQAARHPTLAGPITELADGFDAALRAIDAPGPRP